MSDPKQLAAMIKDVLHDRLEHSTQQQLAFEAASLRAFLFSTIDSLEHIDGHVQRNEITNKQQMHATLEHQIQRLTNSIANLEDVRLELQKHNSNE